MPCCCGARTFSDVRATRSSSPSQLQPARSHHACTFANLQAHSHKRLMRPPMVLTLIARARAHTHTHTHTLITRQTHRRSSDLIAMCDRMPTIVFNTEYTFGDQSTGRGAAQIPSFLDDAMAWDTGSGLFTTHARTLPRTCSPWRAQPHFVCSTRLRDLAWGAASFTVFLSQSAQPALLNNRSRVCVRICQQERDPGRGLVVGTLCFESHDSGGDACHTIPALRAHSHKRTEKIAALAWNCDTSSLSFSRSL
jgi:hypothetical protein